MRMRSAVCFSVMAMLAGGLALPGCGKETSSPGLMLAFSSDMSVPKDISAVGLYIRTRTGAVLYNNVVEASTDAAGNRSVRLPATFAVLSNGAAATVKVQLIAYGSTRKPFVIRQATSGVPTNRLSMLRMPLLWINQGSVPGSGLSPASRAVGLRPQTQTVAPQAEEGSLVIPNEGYETPCKGENESYIGGKCITVDPDAPLPDYVAADAPDAPDAKCFSVEACFAKSESLLPRIKDDGSLDLGGTRASLVNLALVTKDNVGIKLADGRFAISLDADSPLEGYAIKNNVITLSDAVLQALKSGRATDLLATTECSEKTPDVNICGPWNPAGTPLPTGVHGNTPVVAGDAGLVADAGQDAPFVPPDGFAPDPRGLLTSPAEERLVGLSLVGTDVFYLRDGNFPQKPPTIFRASKSPQGQPTGTPFAPIATGVGYRMASFAFPAGAPATWANKTFVTAFIANPTAEASPTVYLGEVGGAGAPPLTFPMPFTPRGVYATALGPVYIGSEGTTATAYIFAGPVASGAKISFNPPLNGELPISVTRSADGGSFVMGTNQSRVVRCTVPGGAQVVCDLVNSKILPGRPVALAEDPNGLVVLAVRPQGTAQEQNYEGLYGVDLIGGTITTFLRHQDHPTDLHFEEAWDTGGNGLTLLGPNVYFTTSPGTGNPSRVYSAPRVQNAKPTIFADGLVRAQDIATDGASLFYVDRGKEDGTAPGFVFQKRAP